MSWEHSSFLTSLLSQAVSIFDGNILCISDRKTKETPKSILASKHKNLSPFTICIGDVTCLGSGHMLSSLWSFSHSVSGRLTHLLQDCCRIVQSSESDQQAMIHESLQTKEPQLHYGCFHHIFFPVNQCQQIQADTLRSTRNCRTKPQSGDGPILIECRENATRITQQTSQSPRDAHAPDCFTCQLKQLLKPCHGE